MSLALLNSCATKEGAFTGVSDDIRAAINDGFSGEPTAATFINPVASPAMKSFLAINPDYTDRFASAYWIIKVWIILIMGCCGLFRNRELPGLPG